MEKEVIPLLQYLEWIKVDFAEKFSLFREMILESGKKFNLTALKEEKEILYKHFLDSVAGEKFFPKNANVCEVGSGAGFPSVPLKIIREDLFFTQIESTGKKCRFLQQVSKTLNLSGISVLEMRAEEAGRMSEYREKFDVCCARAVARMNTLAEYCLPFVKKGGRFIAYKGNAEDELKEAEKAIQTLGGELEKRISFSLPEDSGERTLIIIKKIKETPQKYPRGRGKEKSAPIR